MRTPSARRTGPPDPVRAEVKALLEPWWESQQPRRRQAQRSALDALTAAAHDGWSIEDLGAFLASSPRVITGPALDYWQQGRTNGSTSARRLTDEQHAEIAQLHEHEMAVRQRLANGRTAR